MENYSLLCKANMTDSFIFIVKKGKNIRSFVLGVWSKFLGGGGVMDGEGVSSERCLKWDGGGWGSLRDLSKNILKQGVGKGKSCS